MNTHSLKSAVQAKEAINTDTGLLARVCIKNREFTATAILPSDASRLSYQHKAALYIIYRKTHVEKHTAIGGQSIVHHGVFESISQCIHIIDALKAFGWVKEAEGRYSLTSKGFDFVQNYMYSKGTDAKEAN